jgi:hypothetical protein
MEVRLLQLPSLCFTLHTLLTGTFAAGAATHTATRLLARAGAVGAPHAELFRASPPWEPESSLPSTSTPSTQLCSPASRYCPRRKPPFLGC